jgi:hypothetical protein
MQLETLFKSAVIELSKLDLTFAVAGGLAAALYRDQPRFTMDVDISIFAKSHALQHAQQLMKTLGLEAGIAREADLAGGPLFAIRKGSTKACMVVGRKTDDPSGIGVDILLPALPWVEDAVARAQDNAMDFGFGPVPTLTLEDVILAKLFALKSARLRAKDLDDLQSILGAGHDINMAYLSAQMRQFDITVPKPAEAFLPDIILKISRDIARSHARKIRDTPSMRKSL